MKPEIKDNVINQANHCNKVNQSNHMNTGDCVNLDNHFTASNQRRQKFLWIYIQRDSYFYAIRIKIYFSQLLLKIFPINFLAHLSSGSLVFLAWRQKEGQTDTTNVTVGPRNCFEDEPKMPYSFGENSKHRQNYIFVRTVKATKSVARIAKFRLLFVTQGYVPAKKLACARTIRSYAF